jgi:hypothetical protein
MAVSRRVLQGLAIAAFVTANTFNALNKGGDAQDFFEGGRRWLHAGPLYAGSGPASGFIGPPFQAAFFAPFAALSDFNDVLARIAWYGLNLVCLAAGVVFWSRAWDASRHDQTTTPAVGRSVWLALLAILLPLQTNFEHQNMNALLLCLGGATAYTLVTRKWMAAGALIGLSAALKVFPALAIVYVAARGWWACTMIALATAIVLTALSLLVYGPSAGAQVASWIAVASGGWPTRPQNQSLVAAIDRLLSAGPLTGVHNAQQVPANFGVYVGAAVVLIGLAVLIARRQASSPAQIACEFAAVTVLSVLLSPVAWDHYWVLLFPAYLLMHDAQEPQLLGRRATFVFWTAAILTSGLSRATLGSQGWAVVRQFSLNTLAALIVYGGLLVLWKRLSAVPSVDGFGGVVRRC